MACAVALLAAIAMACTAPSENAPADEPQSIELKVMEFNIEYGGEEVDFHSVIRTIEKSDADLVGLEEAWGNTARIARELGWKYFDPRTQIVSRFPLLAPPGSNGRYTLVEVEPGRVVAMGNVHLPSAPYGPFKVRDGWSRKRIVALESRVRMPAVEPFQNALTPLADHGTPSFLTGDFNAPSQLDWTEETVGLRDHVEYPLEWPVSVALEEAGFEDSYREVHPDPVERPGITWPAARPFVQGYNPARNDAPADRIDFVYAAGPVSTLESALVGEPDAPEVDISVAPWPTDHRAVVSTFEVEPADAPTLVAVERRVIVLGREARVMFHSPGEEGERVVVVRRGEGGEAAVAERSTGGGSSGDGTVAFSTRGWEPDAYDAVLLDGSGRELSRVSFWVQRRGTRPRIGTAEPVYREGEPIDVRWEAAPGNRWDWIGIYRRGANPNIAYYLTWLYTDASIEGSAVVDEDANGRWPLEPGEYSVYLLEDDSYEKLAGGPFTIR